MLDPVLENDGAGKEGSHTQYALTTTPPPLRSSSASTGQSSLPRNRHNLPRDLQSPRAERLTELPSPKRLTPEAMLTHLHTIQDEEQKRLSKRRESSTAVDIISTLHLPPPSPITSAPSPQSPTGGVHPPQPHGYEAGGDDDNDELTLTTPYASCTPHQLSVATSRLHDIAQQFQDVVAGLQDAIARRQSTTTTPPRPELLSLQERLARVHSVAITEHEIVVREVKARRGGGRVGGRGGRRTEEASKRSGGYY
ncbi:hypothetical protein CGCA056_v003664 [Colletotrichum aenigma]|uniref:uncharacterized protein n=1 Tax=Colletotrichum aenigma TaxID=1215731 RepID=UPI0018726131|nr:uncharacterized protein CGCA056_v003664 [Colletotrichum aenigma]KAF5526477.1 hypothetical protein CGCA056_v003664 [Colletotrichum aenigma]